MPSICGSPLTFTSSTLYPTNSLHLASVSKQTNLTRAQTLSKANQPFAFTKKKGDIGNALNKVPRVNDSNNIGNSYQSSNVVSNKNMHRTQSQYPSVPPNGHSPQNSVIADVPRTPRTKPYVPVFTKHKSTKELSKKKRFPKGGGELRKEKPVVPCFKKSVSKSKPSSNDLKIHDQLSSSGVAKVVSRDGLNIVKAGSDRSTVDSPGSNNNEMVVSRDRSSLSLNKKHGGGNTLNGGTQHGRSQRTDGRGVVTTLSGALQFTGEREAGTIFSGSSQYAKQKVDSLVISEENSRSLVEQNQFVEKQSTVPLKKNAKVPDVIVDVRKMVAENKLSKVSAAAIIKWLKSEGVKCKCKDKKQELMFKVYQHLGLVQPQR